ncbi:hypothetical protein, partial [Kamptonema formosum]|uniref:hypothetical protein n=1 Tax=Kamptonema formosum TaxID=331992 RepID=UPI0004780583
KEAIKAQIDSPHLEAWAKIKGKDAVEARNLRRFLLKIFLRMVAMKLIELVSRICLILMPFTMRE